MNINKYQFAERLRSQIGCTHAIATIIIEAFSDIIMSELMQGNSVILNKIGKFCLLDKKERKCGNPQTKKAMLIPPTTVIKFKNFKSIKDILNR